MIVSSSIQMWCHPPAASATNPARRRAARSRRHRRPLPHRPARRAASAMRAWLESPTGPATDSEAAFRRAFKRVTGTTPGAWRETGRWPASIDCLASQSGSATPAASAVPARAMKFELTDCCASSKVRKVLIRRFLRHVGRSRPSGPGCGPRCGLAAQRLGPVAGRGLPQHPGPPRRLVAGGR